MDITDCFSCSYMSRSLSDQYWICPEGARLPVCQHFVDCCEALGIHAAVPFLDRMLVLDYIIANEDRHLNNFGALWNAETLEWIGNLTQLAQEHRPAQVLSIEDDVEENIAEDFISDDLLVVL